MKAPALPPLENGDRLSRDEFERRFEAMPHLKKAELIEGVVCVPSPVRMTQHAGPHADMITWLGVYRAATPGVMLGDNATLRLDPANELQPDALLRLEPSFGGSSQLDEDDYLVGAPELVVEVAASSASTDLHDKLEVYRRNGVREYLVWQIAEPKLHWFELRAGAYVRLEPDEAGILRSPTFPGLWLDAQALLSGDMARVLNVLQTGIDSEAGRSSNATNG